MIFMSLTFLWFFRQYVKWSGVYWRLKAYWKNHLFITKLEFQTFVRNGLTLHVVHPLVSNMNCLDVEALVSLLLLSSNSSLNPLLAEESCWSEFCLLSQTCTPEQIDNVCKLASDHQGNNVIEVVPENNHDIVRRNTKSSGKDFMVAIIQEFSLEKVTIIFEEGLVL